MHFNNLFNICDVGIEEKPDMHLVSVLSFYFRVFEAFKSKKKIVYFCVSQIVFMIDLVLFLLLQ